MALTLTDINVGSTADDGTGDPLRTAFQSVNSNNTSLEGNLNAFNKSDVADGASAVAWDLDTDNTLSVSGAKLLSVKNNTTEKLWVGTEGQIFLGHVDASITRSSTSRVYIVGEATQYRFHQTQFYVSSGFEINSALNPTSTTVPVYRLDNDGDTGLGFAAADQVNLIAGGAEGLRVTNESGAKVVFPQGTLESSVADGATAEAFSLSSPAYSTSGAKLLSVKNNGFEKAYIDKDGVIVSGSDSGNTALKIGQGTTQYNAQISTSASTNLLINPQGSVSFKNNTLGNVVDSLSIAKTGLEFSRDNTQAVVQWSARVSDIASTDFDITGCSAYSSASTNLTGGDVSITAGDGSSGSAGDAHGGDVVLAGGAGYGTGNDGYVLIQDGIYGIMSVQGGSTSQDDIGTTPEILTAWNTDGISNGVTVSSANDYITADVAGTYEVHANISFSGTASSLVTLEIYIYDDSGTSWSASGFALERKIGSTGDVGNAGVSGMVALDTSDRVAIYITTDGATDDVTVTEAQLQIKRISS